MSLPVRLCGLEGATSTLEFLQYHCHTVSVAYAISVVLRGVFTNRESPTIARPEAYRESGSGCEEKSSTTLGSTDEGCD